MTNLADQLQKMINELNVESKAVGLKINQLKAKLSYVKPIFHPTKPYIRRR